MKKLKLPLLITIIMVFVIVENTQAQSRWIRKRGKRWLLLMVNYK